MGELFEAVRTGTLEDVRQALSGGPTGGPDLKARDDQGWSALDWAAGRGDARIVAELVDAGADPLATTTDQRTPYQIALAAGHREAALVLRDAEDAADPGGVRDRGWRPYCKAYPIAELRRFPGWPEGTDVELAFVHDDLSVTASMWPGEDVLYDGASAEWARFCAEELGFRVPDEFDLVPDAR